MSALAKVFVVFICVLSVVFFGTSATLFKTRNDWRTAYNTLNEATQKDLGSLKKRIEELSTLSSNREKDIITLKASQDEQAKTLASTQQALTEKEKDVKLAHENVATANKNATTAGENLKAKEAAYAQLQDSLGKARQSMDDALKQTATANVERDRMRLDLEKTQEELHNLKVEHTQLASTFETVKLERDRAVKALGPNAPGILANIAPLIHAVVKSVDSKEGLVLLSAGKDQKVEIGHEFTVYRGGEFVGKVKVHKVFPDLSGAQILFTKDGAEIQRGDKASTNI
ncbi:MAG: hypothetical protein HY721_22930 [Planctomycetes bacterium]|nr:hypothetical protein [Planctomycetota bacterium]